MYYRNDPLSTSAMMSGDDILLQIRNRFANPDHSAVPLHSVPHNEQGIRSMMVRSIDLVLL